MGINLAIICGKHLTLPVIRDVILRARPGLTVREFDEQPGADQLQVWSSSNVDATTEFIGFRTPVAFPGDWYFDAVEEAAAVNSIISRFEASPSLIFTTSSSAEWARLILASLGEALEFLIDDEAGHLWKSNDFAALLNSSRWDWRKLKEDPNYPFETASVPWPNGGG